MIFSLSQIKVTHCQVVPKNKTVKTHLMTGNKVLCVFSTFTEGSTTNDTCKFLIYGIFLYGHCKLKYEDVRIYDCTILDL